MPVRASLRLEVDYARYATPLLGLERYPRTTARVNVNGRLNGVTTRSSVMVHHDISLEHFPIERRAGVETVNLVVLQQPAEVILFERRSPRTTAEGSTPVETIYVDDWLHRKEVQRVRPEHVAAVFDQHYEWVREHMPLVGLLERPWVGSAVRGGCVAAVDTGRFSLAIADFVTHPDLNLYVEGRQPLGGDWFVLALAQ